MNTAAAVLYIRVSTEEQAAEGLSLAAQEARLRAYCAMRDLAVVEVVTDAGVSAGKPLATRPGGRRVLELAAAGVGAVVAYKLDRLFRDTADCLTVVRAWDKAGVGLHLVDLGGQTLDTASAMGRFFLSIMAAAAELERGLTGERTKAAMGHAKRQGRRVGALPYGSRLAADGVNLEPDEGEGAVLEAARELHAAGLSLRAVAAELARRGFKTRTGADLFDPKQIARMVAA